jgi:hypothetical protein
MSSVTKDDVWLCLHLYEQRREPVLRAARAWMMDFKPRSFRDVVAVIEGRKGKDAQRYFRQATTYWEMVSAIMTSDAISQACRELFARTTREFVLVYARLAPFLEDLRARTRPSQLRSLEGFCRSLPDFEATMAYFARVAGTGPRPARSAPRRRATAGR